MKIIKIRKNDNKAFKDIISLLRRGGIIIYPTETSYGLGCDATKKLAVKKIFKIKRRGQQKSLTLIVSSFRMAGEYVEFDKISWKLARKYWPGPLTLVLPSNCQKKKVYTNPMGKNTNFGIRISPQPLALKLIRALGRPLISTSANISGQKPAYSLRDIVKQFKDKKYQPDLILDFGKLKKIKTSTVVKIKNNKIKILRKGPIKPKINDK